MSRNARHAKILEIIAHADVETQEDLVDALMRAGFNVTQATVSRDIKDLNLVKVVGADGRQKYARSGSDSGLLGRIRDMFRHSVVSVDRAGNIVVIKTIAGSGNVAGRMIDNLPGDEVLGCVAGDDTVFALLRTEGAAEELERRLREAAFSS